MERRSLRHSFEQVGLSVFKDFTSSSKPRATKRALRTTWPPLNLRVQTHLVLTVFCPSLGTSTNVLKSFHFWISSCYGISNWSSIWLDVLKRVSSITGSESFVPCSWLSMGLQDTSLKLQHFPCSLSFSKIFR